MKFAKLKMTLFFSLLIPFSCFSGGWGSGGGENLGDLHNPWFLENTKIITYCVKTDSNYFTSPSAQNNHLIETAIQNWRKVFLNERKRHPHRSFAVGTQDWIRLDCAQDPDLQFNFGWNTLSSSQQSYLSLEGNIKRIVGIAVRTEYDPKSLRGKGFIYIASDQGPNQFTVENGQFERAWQYPALLLAQLTHELGHVFGFPHLMADPLAPGMRGIMSEYFSEIILQKWIWEGREQSLMDVSGIQYFFSPNALIDCSPTDEFRHKFKLNLDLCVLITPRISEGETEEIRLEASNSKGEASALLGTIHLAATGKWGLRSDISVYLTSEQTVFKNRTSPGVPYEMGPGPEEIQAAGEFVSQDGLKFPVFVLLDTDNFSLIAPTEDGKALVRLLDANGIY